MNKYEESSVQAEQLMNKGTCCKSGCIHCPYGFTIKKFGLKFMPITSDNIERISEITSEEIVIAEQDYPFYFYVGLKDTLIGLIKVDHLFVKKMYLHPNFQNQNISKELVESYYFY
jgi:hypothetical protein